MLEPVQENWVNPLLFCDVSFASTWVNGEIITTVNNKKINKDFEKKLSVLNGQALHAKSLGFAHPTKKKFINFKSNIPEDFNKLLNLLEKLSGWKW